MIINQSSAYIKGKKCKAKASFISIDVDDDSSKSNKGGRCLITRDKYYINNELSEYTQALLMKAKETAKHNSYKYV